MYGSIRIGDERRNKWMFDKKAAKRVINFVERRCTHLKGELQGEYIVLLDWQKDWVSKLFGTKQPNGKRRYNNGFLWIPKKNGKSTLVSALSLYLLGPDNEPGAEVYALAGDTDQARIVFGDAQLMIEQDPTLSRLFKTMRNKILYPKLKSTFKVLSAEAKTKHGFNVHGAIFDELHVQPNDELYDTITRGVAARRNPMVISISTAGVVDTFAHNMYKLCKKVHNGDLIMDHWCVDMYEAEYDESDPEAVWALETYASCNPSYGTAIDEDYARKIILESRTRPDGINNYKRLHLNKWVSSLQEWIQPAELLATKEEELTFHNLKDYITFVGTDFASVKDTNAVVYLFVKSYDDDTEKLYWYVDTYVPNEQIDERSLGDVPYAEWANDSYLIVTDGNVADHDFITKDIIYKHGLCNTWAIGYDPWHSEQIIGKIQATNRKLPVFSIAQTIGVQTKAVKFIEKAILNKSLKYLENPVVEWQCSNIIIYEDINNNKKIHKGNSVDKVDIWAALTNAIVVYLDYKLDGMRKRKPGVHVIEQKHEIHGTGKNGKRSDSSKRESKVGNIRKR